MKIRRREFIEVFGASVASIPLLGLPSAGGEGIENPRLEISLTVSYVWTCGVH